MARRKSTSAHETEPFHETLVRVADLIRADTDLLDQIASTRLELAEALLRARFSLCEECRLNLAEDLPVEIDWSDVTLPPGWSRAGRYASYRDRIEQAISEVAYEEDGE